MSRNVCYAIPSDVLSLHAVILWSTVTFSFQYKCIVYIMEWATPSLTVCSVIWAYELFICSCCFTMLSLYSQTLFLVDYTFTSIFISPKWYHKGNTIQESHTVVRKSRDAAALFFGVQFADNIHYKFKSSQASKARLQSSEHTGDTGVKQNLMQNGYSRSFKVTCFWVSGKATRLLRFETEIRFEICPSLEHKRCRPSINSNNFNNIFVFGFLCYLCYGPSAWNKLMMMIRTESVYLFLCFFRHDNLLCSQLYSVADSAKHRRVRLLQPFMGGVQSRIQRHERQLLARQRTATSADK